MRPDQKKDPFTIAVGKRLNLRLGAIKKDIPSFTQATIKKKIGTSKSLVNDWFLGVSLPRAKHLVELSVLLNCSIDWILCGTGDARTHKYYLLTLQDSKGKLRQAHCQGSPASYLLNNKSQDLLLINSQEINSQEYLTFKQLPPRD